MSSHAKTCLKSEYKCFSDAKVCQFFFFFFLNLALKNKSQWFLCLECFKTRPWRLLNQTEMKIVRREPNLCNPILADSQRFETLEGYSVFHRWLSAAAYTHTYYKLLHIAVVTRRSRERFLPALKENPAYSYLILKVLYAYPQLPAFTLSLFSGYDHMTVLNAHRWSCFKKLFHLISLTWQGLNSSQRRQAPLA